MPKTSIAAALHGHWVHSHEEDTDTESVYRPASFHFPPSRGRKSFDLKPGGKVVSYGIGPSDRSVTTTGTWKLQDDDTTLAFYDKSSAKPVRLVHITSVDDERLVISK